MRQTRPFYRPAGTVADARTLPQAAEPTRESEPAKEPDTYRDTRLWEGQGYGRIRPHYFNFSAANQTSSIVIAADVRQRVYFSVFSGVIDCYFGEGDTSSFTQAHLRIGSSPRPFAFDVPEGRHRLTLLAQGGAAQGTLLVVDSDPGHVGRGWRLGDDDGGE